MHPVFTQSLLDSSRGLRYSVNRSVGDGVRTVHPFSFSGGYISKQHIRAYVGDLSDLEGSSFVKFPLTDELFTGAFQLVIEPAITADQVLYIIRDTPKDAALVDLTGTTLLDAGTLMTLAQQAVFVAAEITDRVSELIIDLANATVELPDLGVIQATELAAGIARIATAGEVTTGTADNLIVTPLKLAQVIDALPSLGAAVTVQEDGVSLGDDATTYNFAGGLSAVRVGDIITITPPPAPSPPAPAPPAQTPLTVKDEGTTITSAGIATAFNFVGSGVTVAHAGGGTVTVTVPGGTTPPPSNPPLTVADEGGTLVTSPTSVNFAGGGVTATVVGTALTVTIPGAPAPIEILDEGGSLIVAPDAIDFTGAGVTVTEAGGVITVNIPSSTSVTVQNEGVDLTPTPTAINFTGPGVTATVVGDDVTVDIPGASVGGDIVVDNLQVGNLTTYKAAGFIGTARIYHETNTNLDQVVLAKPMSGTINAGDLGRCWQVPIIQLYDGVLHSSLNPVNVCSANVAMTTRVGSVTAARGSVVNNQTVLHVDNTDTSLGPNEYANSVYLIDPTLGDANAGNTIWGNDWTTYGAKDGPDYSLYGTVQMICRWNPTVATSGQAAIGHLVTTRPKGGAGAQNRTGLYTFPIQVGLAVAGFSGENTPGTVNGAYHAAATNGFDVGIQIGGKLGPWLNEGIYPNGGSKIGTGLQVTDHMTYGIAVGDAHPLASSPLALATSVNAGQVAFGTGTPAAGARVTVNGDYYIDAGTYNGGHLRMGSLHIWNNAGVPYYKNSAPSSASDGTAMSGGGGAVSSVTAGSGISVSPTTGTVVVTNTGVTSLTAGSGISLTAGSGAVTISTVAPPGYIKAFGSVDAAGSTTATGVGWSSMSKTGTGQYLLSYTGVTAPVGVVSCNGVGFAYITGGGAGFATIETRNNAGALADIGFSFHIMSV